MENKTLNTDSLEVSIVMPCLNEEETIAACIEKAKRVLEENNLRGEVIVSDNGSTDRSVEIASKLGARVVHQKIRGYGNAYKKGIAEARGKFILIGDSDNTYDFSIAMDYIKLLRKGYEFVNGSRFKGKIHKGAMPFLHQYFGNPFLTFILNMFFKSGFSDVYCGLKAFTKETYKKINPVSSGMEFALELIINASREEVKRTEIPIQLYPRKGGEVKLRTFIDGWRSLRFMLLYCPNYLFIFPGSLIFLTGLIGMTLLLNGPVMFLNHTFNFHAMIFSSMLSLLGFQLINLGFFAKSYALAEGFERKNSFFSNFYRFFDLEKGILLGIALTLLGFFMALSIIKQWITVGPVTQERQELFSLTIMIIGIQTMFSSFLISLIGMKNRE